VQAGLVSQYLDLVRKVGVDLRSLLSSVDILVAVFPPAAHREVREANIYFLFILIDMHKTQKYIDYSQCN